VQDRDNRNTNRQLIGLRALDQQSQLLTTVNDTGYRYSTF